ncbi:hypothetical protein [[Actinomadura] parvosata]|uniref:hypothetical protein n=1 Tax=[Actinomadura] parvosata TaxID=1955412 RepID=UPI0012BBE9BA|nr:hypothetical protein [Nonomuraea sp. ATCC 55076]
MAPSVVLLSVDPDPGGWGGALVRVTCGVPVAGAVVVMTRLLLAGARKAAPASPTFRYGQET